MVPYTAEVKVMFTLWKVSYNHELWVVLVTFMTNITVTVVGNAGVGRHGSPRHILVPFLHTAERTIMVTSLFGNFAPVCFTYNADFFSSTGTTKCSFEVKVGNGANGGL